MAKTLIHADRFTIIRRRALERGEVVRDRTFSRPHVRWDIAGNCEHPVRRELETCSDYKLSPMRQWGRRYEVGFERSHSSIIVYYVRCRKCASCLRARSFQWRIRMRQELAQSVRTWFGTLTMRPSEHVANEYRTRLRLSGGGTNFDDLTEVEQLQELCKTVGSEITKFLKRVRKNSGAPLRYCLVVERHKTPEQCRALGLPVGENAGKLHFLSLIHI